ncbi:MAG: nuclear transport factor 2 family protein, partial [Gammaproteobacteria bacterium]|nr:nuclear transport factor 2 family protein [Gammaproteobacteria bacterium]
VFTNESITLDGDRARASTKWLFVTQSSDNRPTPVYLGHYDDSLVREADGWKFQRRVVYGDIPAQDPLAAEAPPAR